MHYVFSIVGIDSHFWGAARAIEALAKSLDCPSEAAKFKLAQQYIHAQIELATSENSKVIISNSDSSSDALIKALAIYTDGKKFTSRSR